MADDDQSVVGGIIMLQIGGEIQDAKGDFTYNLGRPKSEAVLGSDRVHGRKTSPQVPFIEGAITDRRSLDLNALVTGKNQTITLRAPNGKTITLGKAWYAGEGTVSTGEGEIGVRWEAKTAEDS